MHAQSTIPVHDVEPKGGFDTPDLKQSMRAILNQRGQEIGYALEQYLIPEEKAEKVSDYAIRLLVTNPKMKTPRIVRKTVEYFKLQLKD